MEQPESMNGITAEPVAETPSIDPKKMEELKNQLYAEQNLLLGIVGGVVSAVIGATIWAVVTVATEYQIGWMAVGVGFLVGYAVRILGKGISTTFGVVGASCALVGCILGNLLSSCGFLANQESVPVLQVVVNVLTQPAVIVELLKVTFSPMDVLFYAIAVYEGYKFSFRQITEQQLADLSGT